MKIKIISQEQNPLLKRTEVAFQVEHRKEKGTPSRLQVREGLASQLKKEPQLVYIRKMETRTGTMTATGQATAYESVEQARLVEPEH
ncbi:30S ribosomal protein S24e, partial [Candidatus Bathyarchaeota archaeon]|nr:30S ribosomal protein S24e [Candidatus Bathyarchaeota archaeon]NIU81299.1 30S ribosomal protein S24e [Candidatus Bathyarchaeota archaeon]NIV67934.1 30S ribosomal protein S24e [Candidatus Bathyarchaeota archaeon]NIW16375.1 30S ribosomal protein S24e [Candidatus Bathyarchaeota archaeon]